MQTKATESAAGQRSELPRLLLFAFLALHAIFPLMWLSGLVTEGHTQGDWYTLKLVAEHFVAGDWTNLYATGADAINPGYFWRYPPFALYLVAPLAWLPDAAAYGLLAGLEVGAMVAAMGLLARLAPLRGATVEWALAVLLSAPMLTTLVAGQSSALITLCVVGAATLWTRGRVVAACAVLGLLALKPNWGVFFGLYALVRGEWRGAGAMVAVVAALCALSLPLGLDLWRDFFAMSAANEDVLVLYEPFKLITLKGFLDAVLGHGALASALWGAAAVGLLGAAVAAWREPAPPVRHLGVALLLVVAVNPYASFYDALVLAVPATVWWSEREAWRPGRWWAVGALIAVAWCWEQSGFAWDSLLDDFGIVWVPPWSLVGPAASAWLVLEALEARHRARAAW